MLKLEDVFVVFHSSTPLERVALRSVNLDIKEGEFITIIGNNGSGRTTLLKLLSGHIAPSFGRIWYGKTDITSQSLFTRSEIFSSVFYDVDSGTAGNLTILENLAVANMHHQSRSIFSSAVTTEMREAFYEQLKELSFLGMEELMDEKVMNISRVHRQILALLIAVVKGAKILLIDEHSSGLDQESSAALLEVTEQIIRSRKITTIMSVSDPQFALSASDRTIVLSHGQIVKNLAGEERKQAKIEDLFSVCDVIPA